MHLVFGTLPSSFKARWRLFLEWHRRDEHEILNMNPISKAFVFGLNNDFIRYSFFNEGDAVTSWLVRSTPERVVRVGALAGDIVLCPFPRHCTLAVPLSTGTTHLGISSGLMGHLTRMQTLPYLT